MVNKKIVSIIILYCCFVSTVSHSLSIVQIQQNMHNKELDKKLNKQIFSFVKITNGLMDDHWYYTTELSRILLVGEPTIFEFLRWYQILDTLCIIGPLFDNRFNDFIENIERFSQYELEEAIQDALLLSPYSSKGYSTSKLLNYLTEALQQKIDDIKEQIEYGHKWHQKSCTYLKKSIATLIGLIAMAAITNKYRTNNINNSKEPVSNLEALHAIATLGCIPASYCALRGSYKVLTTDPNTSNQHLKKHEELLLFLQKLTLQLETNDCITFELASGYSVSIKNNKLIFNT